MKIHNLFWLSLISIVIFVISVPSIGRTDDEVTSWEKFPQGVWLDIRWVSWKDHGKEINALDIKLKNVSDSQLYLMITPHNNSGFRFFFIDGNGVKTALHDYSETSSDSVPQVVQASLQPTPISPGQVIETTVLLLSPREIDLVKSLATECAFSIANQPTNDVQSLNSKPRKLSRSEILPPN